MYRPAQVNNSLIWDQVLTPDVLFKRPSMHYWSSMQQTIDFHLLYNLIQPFFSAHGFVCLSESAGIYSLCPASDQFIVCLGGNTRFIGIWVIKIHAGLTFQVTALAGYNGSPSWHQLQCVGRGFYHNRDDQQDPNILQKAVSFVAVCTHPKNMQFLNTSYSAEKCLFKWKMEDRIDINQILSEKRKKE